MKAFTENIYHERSVGNGDFSYDMLTTDDFNGEDILIDTSQEIDEAVIHKIMLDKLHDSLVLLSDDEQKLINALFFRKLSEREWADETGIPQKTINDRKRRILIKLKNFWKVKNKSAQPLQFSAWKVRGISFASVVP